MMTATTTTMKMVRPALAAAISSSSPSPSTDAPAAAAAVTSTPAAVMTDSMGTAYAACMASGNPNTPYCPHNAGNREAPTAETKIVPGQPVRLTWNSQWSPFAAAGAIDLYLCPADASACVPLAMGRQDGRGEQGM
ncbi:hypothetical protein AMAG_15449 [Allomyces macrogynus ATCC 38327]|uniref:Uncharacterized protein n=1 Tax=Allomyces macrogynus (strain ATCC 38327) TaxID=578462 RepID=A0A0L0T7G6_ALLM3|nr:hypothetical protein AMAG_15449 [Allomyces macrogynus ATCC 38327]|eukprot:KNE70692.1 hypothetical protein AMAG_15449 [Allomyces macrogynus ATCC 38327]